MSATELTRLQRITYRVWLSVGVVLLVAVSVWLLYRPLAVILAPLLVALILVYLLNPIVDAFQHRRVPRIIGAVVAYLLVGSGLTVLITLFVPLLNREIAAFAEAAPDLSVTLKERLTELFGFVGLDVDVAALISTQDLAARVQEFVAEGENRETVVAVLAGLSGLARGALFVVYTVVVGPVVAFYVLADLPRLLTMARQLIPPAYRLEVAQVSRRLGHVVGGFVRGQLMIATFVGVASWIVLGLLGLPFALLIGVIAGVTNLVPLLGPFVAGVLGVTVALVTEGPGFALLVAAAMTGVQQLESSLLNPLIMGRSVRVHPLAVLLGIIVAGALYGVVGMLVVVPLVAGAKVLLMHLWSTRVPWAEQPGEAGLFEDEAGGSPDGFDGGGDPLGRVDAQAESVTADGSPRPAPDPTPAGQGSAGEV